MKHFLKHFEINYFGEKTREIRKEFSWDRVAEIGNETLNNFLKIFK